MTGKINYYVIDKLDDKVSIEFNAIELAQLNIAVGERMAIIRAENQIKTDRTVNSYLSMTIFILAEIQEKLKDALESIAGEKVHESQQKSN